MAATVARIGSEATPVKPAEASTSLSVKEAIAMAFEQLGGVTGLTAWVEASPDGKKAFYTQIWPKILGAEAKEAGFEHGVVEEIRETIVDPRPADGAGL